QGGRTTRYIRVGVEPLGPHGVRLQRIRRKEPPDGRIEVAGAEEQQARGIGLLTGEAEDRASPGLRSNPTEHVVCRASRNRTGRVRDLADGAERITKRIGHAPVAAYLLDRIRPDVDVARRSVVDHLGQSRLSVSEVRGR